MSLKRNVLASYASQAYVTVVGIVMIPLYLRYMGTEAYGLVGFFAVLQSLFQLLDMGLTPTMSRETARYKGGAIDGVQLARLMRALEGIFIGLAIFGSAVIVMNSELISTRWLKVNHLALSEVKSSIILMGFIVGLRWVGGLYRGAVNGFERLVWLSGFNVVAATARFVLVIPYFKLVGSTPIDFFSYQFGVALLELAILAALTYRLLPLGKVGISGAWKWKPIANVLKFSLSVAFTSSVWVFVTQTDKLVLSKILPLSDYAYFTLAVLVANGVFVVSGPISAVLMPRMTRLNAEGDDEGVIQIYRKATQIVGWLAISAAFVLAFFAEKILWAWTGDAAVAQNAAPVLKLYVLGNGVLALAAFPYYLQFAKGDMRLHIIGNVIFIVLLIPSLVWAASKYGAVGAGYAWLTSNLVYFLVWVPKVHRRFVKGLHLQWLLRDVCATAVLALVGTTFAHALLGWPKTRLATAVELGALSIGVLVTAAFGVEPIREKFFAVMAMVFPSKSLE
jgi:O-antigen/teichoic acid export membrane protein